jgi:UDP-N-acetylmuramate dehydrogenase
VAAVSAADAAGEPLLLLGGGSNLLVADAGFPGTVVRLASTGCTVRREGDAVVVTAAAGHPWDALVDRAVQEGWSGLEALSGIPGTVGATPIQNVGAYGAEVAQLLEALTVLDRRTGVVGPMTPAQAELGYRTSVLKRSPGRWVVLDVTFRLALRAEAAPIRYAELARTLGVEVGRTAPAAEVRAAVLGLRRGKGMVLDDTDPDTWSAGSFFTNPILPADRAAGLPAGAPQFPQADGRIKTSAAWLISRAGFERGYTVRPGAPASLSTKHVLALTNRGAATAADLLELARVVRARVQQQFGILLEAEPVLVGCEL